MMLFLEGKIGATMEAIFERLSGRVELCWNEKWPSDEIGLFVGPEGEKWETLKSWVVGDLFGLGRSVKMLKSLGE